MGEILRIVLEELIQCASKMLVRKTPKINFLICLVAGTREEGLPFGANGTREEQPLVADAHWSSFRNNRSKVKTAGKFYASFRRHSSNVPWKRF